ncbi:uncharacterized protein LOC115383790 isoform X2 [Salarias fasciatus]|nr:uncharacterized protein LOC115383790 isoform X2 [Salarias fasciatus]
MASISNVSSKYQDLLSRSILISEGRPKIYQLKPTEEKIGTVTRMTVGEKNQDRPNKTVLLVGEIRTGKSSLVNVLFNHMMGVTWEDEVWFQLVEEEENSNQTESQTSDVVVYQIFGYEGNAPPYSLTIIDTPGFGDTRVIERDAMISERLLDLFGAEGGVLSVHAVGLVMKSSDNHLSDRLLYAFNSVMSLFGKDMERNIVALMTQSDGLTPQNALKALEGAKIKCAVNKMNQPTHFLFNNLQKKERTEEEEFILEHAWKITKRGMNQFTAFLDEVTPQQCDCSEASGHHLSTMAFINNVSSKYQDLVSRSTLISGGCPKIYQLKPRKEKIGTVARMTVGEKNLNRPNKTVLLVGEIRTGKSSLINALFNHMMGVTWEDEVWFQLVKEEENSNQTESQTSDVMVYQIFGYEGNAPPYSLTIIDTPGFGDTRVIERDAMICERLLGLFRAEDGVCSVHAVGLVLKSSENRLSDRLLYAFNSVMSLFGKDMERNIVALMTQSDGLTPQNALKALEAAKIKCVRNKKKQPTHFLFNNLQKTERTEEEEFILEHAWKISKRGMDQFTAFLDETTPQQCDCSEASGHHLSTMASISNVSSKYKDLLSRSTLISEGGHPKIYQLNPTKDNIGTVARMTVGEKNLNRPNKTILLVGETGTGKSALINALFNHMMGVTWEDEVWFQLVEEGENSSDQKVSQTPDVMVYQIFGDEGNAPPYSLTIIDTPGFGDTRGIEHDAMISERLLGVFRAVDGVRSVDAVGLVLKSSVNRLKDELLYAFNSVMSLFGKDMERNIVALMTHSDGLTPQNALKALEAAKIKCVRNKKIQLRHYLFNNQQKTERTKENERSLKFAWETSEKGMDQFTAFFDKITPQKLDETVNVLNERVRLTACIKNLQERIDLIEKKRREIQQKQEAVRKYEEKVKKNESFIDRVDEPYKEKEEIPSGWFLFLYSGAVCCTSCEENCHYPGCSVAWTAGWCEVMRDGRCTVCSGKCPVSSHVKDNWRYVTKTREVEYTNEKMKEDHEKYKSAGAKGKTLLESLKDQKKKMEEEKSKLLDEAYQHVLSLEEIALNINSVSTYVHYDFLIKKMLERGDQEKVQKLEEMKRRVEEGSQSVAAYVWNKMKGIPSRRKKEKE